MDPTAHDEQDADRPMHHDFSASPVMPPSPAADAAAPASTDSWHMPEPAEQAAAADKVAETAAPDAPAAPEPAHAWHMPESTPAATLPDPTPTASGVDTPAESPVPSQPALGSWQPNEPTDPTRPVPVVRVLSPVGVEYVFMTVALFVGAIGMAAALLSLVNGKTDFSVLAFPTAMLVVSVPVFASVFLHLKKLEAAQPNLRLDPSKRRSTQFTQIVSFVASLFTLIGLVFSIFAKLGGQSSVSIGKAFLDALCILVVAGGILFYYWRDEHKER